MSEYTDRNILDLQLTIERKSCPVFKMKRMECAKY